MLGAELWFSTRRGRARPGVQSSARRAAARSPDHVDPGTAGPCRGRADQRPPGRRPTPAGGQDPRAGHPGRRRAGEQLTRGASRTLGGPVSPSDSIDRGGGTLLDSPISGWSRDRSRTDPSDTAARPAAFQAGHQPGPAGTGRGAGGRGRERRETACLAACLGPRRSARRSRSRSSLPCAPLATKWPISSTGRRWSARLPEGIARGHRYRSQRLEPVTGGSNRRGQRVHVPVRGPRSVIHTDKTLSLSMTRVNLRLSAPVDGPFRVRRPLTTKTPSASGASRGDLNCHLYVIQPSSPLPRHNRAPGPPVKCHDFRMKFGVPARLLCIRSAPSGGCGRGYPPGPRVPPPGR
jgi:hypothetical protein